MKPKYVYAHGGNLAIVLSALDDKEEGIYVALSTSSGPGPEDDQIARTLEAGNGRPLTVPEEG